MTTSLSSIPERPRSRAPRWGTIAAALVALYAVAAVPLILLMGVRGRPGDDQINFHEPAVRTFAAQLPTPDLHDYLSATTPGYHLALAPLVRFVTGDVRILQLAGASFTVLLLVVLARAVATRTVSWVESAVVCLPFICSMYVFQAGVWLVPDNAGWLMVLLCLALALREPFTIRTVVLGGLALLGVVLFRQVHLWAAGVLWAAAWLAPGIDNPGRLGQLFTRLPQRLRSLAPMLLASIPAFVVLAIFVRMWGGLTPPSFQGQYKGLNFAAFAFVLSLLGIGSAFFGGYLVDAAANSLRRHRLLLVLAAAGGAAIAIIPPTTYSQAAGRWTGIWSAAAKLPTIAGHTSPVMVVLSTIGAVTLALWCLSLRPRDRWIFLGALFGFAASQVFVAQLWQRYSEPFVLMLLALMAVRVEPTSGEWELTRKMLRPARLGSVALFAAMLAGLAGLTISRFPPAAVYDLKILNPVQKSTPSSSSTPPPHPAVP